MKFTQTELAGAYVISLEKHEDARGFFARTFSIDEFEKLGLDADIKQCNISFNKKKGTLRGMHYQVYPKSESKLIQCIKGSACYVIIDLRKKSKTYKRIAYIKLHEENKQLLYVPKNFAVGFQTLEDNTELFYTMFEFFSPDHSRTIRYDDPEFSIQWPLPISVISEKDSLYQKLTS